MFQKYNCKIDKILLIHIFKIIKSQLNFKSIIIFGIYLFLNELLIFHGTRFASCDN